MEWGSVHHHARSMEPIKSRRRCHCGCRTRVTHMGTCNGIGMTEGCELYIRRWVKDWQNAYSAAARRAAQTEGGGDG